MVQPSQQHVAPCVKVVEWELVTRDLGILTAFWAGIPVEVTKKAGVVPRLRRAAIWIPFYSPHMTRRETVDVFTGGNVLNLPLKKTYNY